MSPSPWTGHPRPATAPTITSAAATDATRVVPRGFLRLVVGVLAALTAAAVFLLSGSVTAALLMVGLVAVVLGLCVESVLRRVARTAEHSQREQGERQ